MSENLLPTVAVLFARKDSIYKSLPGCDVWDIDRDARKWPGGCPIVAHPPCRAWGRLRHLSKPRSDEKDLALWAVDQVRTYGGVLEHPARSSLWPAAGLPERLQTDSFGGWTLTIFQSNFGHRAEKSTWLYICGLHPGTLSAMPFVLGEATHVVSNPGRRRDGSRLRNGDVGWRPEITKAEREHTPRLLAKWMVDAARRCSPFGGHGLRVCQSDWEMA